VGGPGSPRATGTALLVGIVPQAGYRQIFDVTNEFVRLSFEEAQTNRLFAKSKRKFRIDENN
jgi:hypothetical protein